METRPFGRTGARIPILSLGCQRLCDEERCSEDEALAILNTALDRGITYFDTAWRYSVPRGEGGVYGVGQSEQRVGMVAKHRREEMWIATKWHVNDRDGARRQLEESLTRLQTDHVDEWRFHCMRSFHRLDLLTGKGGALEAAIRAKEEGLVRFISFSVHSDPMIAIEALRRYPFDTVLVPVSPMDHFVASFANEFLPVAAQQKVGVIGMKLLGVGRLAQVAPLAIRYALGLPLTTVIVGCSKLSELQMDLEIAENYTPLSIDERVELFRYAAALLGPENAPWSAQEYYTPDEWRPRRDPGGLALLAAMGGATPEDVEACRRCEDAPGAAL